MKTSMHFSLLGAGIAALFTVLALVACQNPDPPDPSVLAGKDGVDPAVRIPNALVPEGRKATAEEIARFEAAPRNGIPSELTDAPAPLAKTAALPICMVDFNQVSALNRLPDDGYLGLSFAPHYAHNCNTTYYANVVPIIAGAYRLTPEAEKWCSVAPDKIGTRVLRGCINQERAIYWARKAGTIGDTTLQFFVVNSQNARKYFDLRSIVIKSGTATIATYIPGSGWVVWSSLTAQFWQWSPAIPVGEMRIYPENTMGGVEFDNVEIAIRP